MFSRKKKDDWWQQTGQEQNEASANADQAAPSTGADTAAEAAPDTSPEAGKKKRRWAWLDAAGDILEVVIDFIVGLFD